jgi:hypothetical protein
VRVTTLHVVPDERRIRTVRDDLERARLELRARQLERVLFILNPGRRGERRGLHRAIDDFARELEQVRARLSSRDEART